MKSTEQNNKRFLYGASIQGIQSFIFQTNKMRDFAGASEIVEQICNHEFNQFIESDGKYILNAAGNIRYLFSNKSACEKAVKEFPRLIEKFAPGIPISQAVIELSDAKPLNTALTELEYNLRIQRNNPLSTTNFGFIATKRCKRTGLPSVGFINGEDVDVATMAKINSSQAVASRFKEKIYGEKVGKEFAVDINQIGTEKSWIAVIHADGNSLGKIIQQIATQENADVLLNKFSTSMEEATILSARAALNSIEQYFNNDSIIPLRPIVLGGDDLTVICRADVALMFTHKYLIEFEKNTKSLFRGISTDRENELLNDGLNACAGIAYIKKSYPFHYGYKLASEICDRAKEDSGRKKSCLMFHKVQNSFISSYDSIISNELSVRGNPILKFGPYYIDDSPPNKWTISKLLQFAGSIEKITPLRSLLNTLFKDPNIAKQELERIISNIGTTDSFLKETLKEFSNTDDAVPFFDALSLISVETLLD